MRTLFWATICFWGAILSILPVISILISENAYRNSAINSFLKNNSDALLSVGTLLLISLLAILQVHIANVASEKREQSNRKTQVEMKLSEFRQAWILDLRDLVSEFSSLVHDSKSADEITRMRALATKIPLFFDPNQDDYKKVLLLITEFLKAKVSGDQSFNSKSTELEMQFAYILDREWGKMKAELIRAQSQNEDIP